MDVNPGGGVVKDYLPCSFKYYIMSAGEKKAAQSRQLLYASLLWTKRQPGGCCEMTIDKDDLLNSILESMDRIQNIKLEDIPNIDLYMDQVTTFMDRKLHATTRKPGEDKILTKTMINNYAKNDLLPPPVKKKYSKEHILMLIFIYYCKGMLSINDIQVLLGPLAERYFQKSSGISLSSIYEEAFGMEEDRIADLKEDIVKKYELAGQTFADAPKEDQEILRLFSFIFMLGYDVYVKKLLIEKLIDNFKEVSDGAADEQGKKAKAAKEKNPKDKTEKEKASGEKKAGGKAEE